MFQIYTTQKSAICPIFVKKLVQQTFELGNRADVALTKLGVFSELDYTGGTPNNAKIFERHFLRLVGSICATQFFVSGLSAVASYSASSSEVSRYCVARTFIRNFGTYIIDFVCAFVRIAVNDGSNINR
jgi:hypothetical protein